MKYIIPIIILSLFLLGCKKDDDSSTATTELEGTWVVSCYASGSYYLKKTLIVSGSDVTTDKWEYFTDSSCANAYELWDATFKSLSIGDVYEQSSYGTSGGSGHKLTMTIITNTLAPQSSDAVSWGNNNSYCGLTGWELNVAKDIAGKTCGSGTLWANDITIYGLYILDGNKFFPNFTSGSYADNVSTLDSNKYIKQ